MDMCMCMSHVIHMDMCMDMCMLHVHAHVRLGIWAYGFNFTSSSPSNMSNMCPAYVICPSLRLSIHLPSIYLPTHLPPRPPRFLWVATSRTCALPELPARLFAYTPPVHLPICLPVRLGSHARWQKAHLVDERAHVAIARTASEGRRQAWIGVGAG